AAARALDRLAQLEATLREIARTLAGKSPSSPAARRSDGLERTAGQLRAVAGPRVPPHHDRADADAPPWRAAPQDGAEAAPARAADVRAVAVIRPPPDPGRSGRSRWASSVAAGGG